jgi:glycosyltransferase involved in cell wall biosynthesis
VKIAQVAPLFESVPPRNYGGTERVVHYLTEELVRLGHEVTLFATGDSVTSARLVPVCPRALRTDPGCVDQLAHQVRLLEEVTRRASQFDVIHFHIDYLHFPVSRRIRTPHVSTLHGRLDIPDLQPLYREFAEVPLISISDAQRAPLAFANWQATVYHGLPHELHTFQPEPGRYLVFVGRVSPEKGLSDAIAISRRVGMPLRIAAKIDRFDQEYFDTVIRPQLARPDIEFMGEAGGEAKDALIGGAYACLFPIGWPEPFGLVMLESMACGTPVIAYRRGSVPEVMRDGVSGFVVDGVDEAVAALDRVGGLSRRACRDYFEERFTAPRMAADYARAYERLAAARRWPPGEVDGMARRLELPSTTPLPAGDGGGQPVAKGGPTNGAAG